MGWFVWGDSASRFVCVNRRHLSREQKRELIAESLRADPILRDREHARRCGVNHETVGRVRADEGIPTPDEVIRAEIERSGDNDYQIGQRLGVSQNTVSKVRADFQNGENRQNENTTPEPEPGPEPPAPSWREYERALGVDQKTVKRVREDSQNGENRQNANNAPEPEPEPPAPSWEPAGHLHTNAPQAP